MITYDKDGLCTKCRLPVGIGSGFVADGVCMCGDNDCAYPNHDFGCTCKKCEDAWEKVEYHRYDSGYDRN